MCEGGGFPVFIDIRLTCTVVAVDVALEALLFTQNN